MSNLPNNSDLLDLNFDDDDLNFLVSSNSNDNNNNKNTNNNNSNLTDSMPSASASPSMLPPSPSSPISNPFLFPSQNQLMRSYPHMQGAGFFKPNNNPLAMSPMSLQTPFGTATNTSMHTFGNAPPSAVAPEMEDVTYYADEVDNGWPKPLKGEIKTCIQVEQPDAKNLVTDDTQLKACITNSLNRIYILNDDNVQLGYLLPDQAAFLLPLLKKGKIYIYVRHLSNQWRTTVMGTTLSAVVQVFLRSEGLDMKRDGKEDRESVNIRSYFEQMHKALELSIKKSNPSTSHSQPSDTESRPSKAMKFTFGSSGSSTLSPVEQNQQLAQSKSQSQQDEQQIPNRPPLPVNGMDEQTKFYMDRLYQAVEQQNELDEMDPPPSLRLDLRGYQKQALAWMVYRERKRDEENRKLHPLYTKKEFADGSSYYYNKHTGDIAVDFPPAPQDPLGGILADEMGLGKTIEILALIVTNPCPMKRMNIHSSSRNKTIHSKATLIVCPLSLASQWMSEIQSNTYPPLSTYLYYGSSRTRDAHELASYDVVITTYNTLSSEYGMIQEDSKNFKGHNSSPLYRIHFFRCVLDEAHQIKNRKANQTKAVWSVAAKRRWCLTGTPIQNSIDDLYSLVNFLRVEPFSQYYWWSNIIARPFEKKDPHAFFSLTALTKSLLLRRTKDQKINGKRIVTLPEKHIHVMSLSFSSSENQFYKSLYQHSKSQVEKLMQTGTVMKNFANVLELLLRLRQACNHPMLILNSIKKRTQMNSDSSLFDYQSLLSTIMTSEGDSNGRQCMRCEESVSDFVITPCQHTFCQECIGFSMVLSSGDESDDGIVECSVCKREFSQTELKYSQKSPSKPELSNHMAELEHNFQSSTKIDALLQDVTELLEKDPTTKIVVFSQWTSMLDLIGITLRRSGIEYVRLDGSMARRDREKSVVAFRDNRKTNMMLMSLKAGGVGLNLVWATHVFIIDPWWNPAVEEQAIDRVHRIGQKREVTVKKFVVKDTVEERIVELQKHKKALAQGTLGMSKKDMKKIRMDDIKHLFNI
eukprot:gb/GECH01010291.1/.p1 GENE.gb/GECH01010291.1/~~gb/GECH01010291.1/.p1  ORF type:complete len:1033 (+),score=245.46 gb/GECH01010291.1/:1-3099(+)